MSAAIGKFYTKASKGAPSAVRKANEENNRNVHKIFNILAERSVPYLKNID